MKVSLLKTAAKGIIIGAAVFAFAGAAGATTTINLYGASAQTNFWNGAAADLLHVEFGCATGAVTTASPTDSKSKVTHGTVCSHTYDHADDNVQNGIINFSYSNKASWDGIEAANGVWDTTGNNGTASQPCTQGQNYRKVATCADTACTPSLVTSTCQPVTIGTSDVEASAFSQASTGYQYGPLTGGVANLSRAFYLSDDVTPGIDTSNLGAPSSPIAYPFGFYVNPGVTTTRCSTSSPTAADINNLCIDDSQCGGSVGGTTYCTAQTIDNLSRLQVVALFSGVVKNWNDFGVYYPNKPVTLCMRHAGSGTSATLDLGIMEGNGWGTGLVQNEQPVSGATQPYVYFNDGTSDAQNCLEWVGGESFSTERTTVGTALNGGIGYWDADAGPFAGNTTCQSGLTAPCGAYAGPIKFNGVAPSRITMHDGLYDNFWTINRMYAPRTLSTTLLTMVDMIVSYLDSPTNVTTALASGNKGLFYGAASELNFNKNTSIAYPYVYAPAASSATPN